MNITLLTKFSLGMNIVVFSSLVYLVYMCVKKPEVILSPVITAILNSIYDHKVSFFDTYALNTNDIIFLGDSITEGANWDEVFPNTNIKNRGISGDTTTGVLKRLHQITDAKPRAVFVKLGTNDIGLSSIPDTQSYKRYHEIIKRIRAESPQTKIFLQSILPRETKYKQSVEAFNKEIQIIAKKFDIPYINIYPNFLLNGAISEKYSNDQLHLNGEGYQVWQQALMPYVTPFSNAVDIK